MAISPPSFLRFMQIYGGGRSLGPTGLYKAILVPKQLCLTKLFLNLQVPISSLVKQMLCALRQPFTFWVQIGRNSLYDPITVSKDEDSVTKISLPREGFNLQALSRTMPTKMSPTKTSPTEMSPIEIVWALSRSPKIRPPKSRP